MLHRKLRILLLYFGLLAAVTSHAAPPKKKAPEPAAAPTPPPAPVALPAPVTVAAPLEPGALFLTVDADTDEVTVGGQAASLKKGENRFGLPAGTVQWSVKFANGLTVKGETAVPPGGEAHAEAWSTGKLLLHVGEGAKVEIDGKIAQVASGLVQQEVGIGSHTLVVTQPGYIGRKASVDVTGGHTTEITANLDKFDVPVDNTLAWVSIIGGGALIVSAFVIDAVAETGTTSADVRRWSLLSVGTAGFVGGTLLLKHNLDEVGAPPTKDGTFDVRVTRYGNGALALVGWRF